MEKVFWLMWLADVCGSVGVVGWITAITLGTMVVCLAIGFAATDGELDVLLARPWLIGLAAILGVCMLFPNSNTVRMMAAASAGEALADTKLGQKSIQALNAVLDRVIDSQAKK